MLLNPLLSLSRSPSVLQRPSSLLRPLSSSNLPPIQGGSSSPSLYCRSLVQRLDHDAFLTSYFWPAGRKKDAFFALRAFNIELASIQETVSNPAIGRMRLQFWRDAVRDLSNGLPPPLHPIPLLLSQTTTPSTRDLTAYYLNQIIDAREANLLDPPPPTLTSLLTTLSTTSTPLHLLSLSLLTPTPPAYITSSVQHLSLSIGLTNLLRALPFHLSRRRAVGLPLDLCAKERVVMEKVFRIASGKEGGEGGLSQVKGLREVVWEVAVRANDELMTARRELELEGGTGFPVGKEFMPVFLSAIPARSYLQRLEQLDGDAFDPSLQRRHWRVPLDVWLAWRRGRF
ncbi:isoprenoid synthase domain-containing protein [Mrakia frigida]|uniref:isoprenoid synthase domain-containing protein n=1 Tax=Mrakia frigida TaxID=29902 RepID=UPI003FCBFF1C